MTAEQVSVLYEARGTVALDELIGFVRMELADVGEDFEDFVSDRLPRTQQAAHSVGPYAWRLLPKSDRVWLLRHLRMVTSAPLPWFRRTRPS
ncbi:hypothetical protein [uncultured Streptomyces sp.]|uniref:hypothetical protein n=1 Tax=uncultured Streptomyces sp. TaxID=174707 RepID=UPI00260A613C|nr:hypothetical protein [uncultured Streptomyces sp.]